MQWWSVRSCRIVEDGHLKVKLFSFERYHKAHYNLFYIKRSYLHLSSAKKGNGNEWESLVFNFTSTFKGCVSSYTIWFAIRSHSCTVNVPVNNVFLPKAPGKTKNSKQKQAYETGYLHGTDRGLYWNSYYNTIQRTKISKFTTVNTSSTQGYQME